MKNIHNLTRYSLRQIKSAVFSRRTRLQLKAIVFSQRYNCHLDVPSLKNRVNVFEYHPDKVGYNRSLGPYNLGDSLGLVIVDYLLSNRGLKRDAPVKGRKHLFTVGSNIFGGEYIGNYQNATIWGSGILKEPSPRLSFLQRLSHRHLDIRAVRGPLTREVLLRFGHNCPEVYGDPAILMPMIYSPSDTTKKNDFIVIPQFYNECIFRDEHPDLPMVSMNTNDYQSVIDKIVASKIVYTSSLHGIILAESYGVPAVFYRGLAKTIDFKYKDYYYSTGRFEVPMVDTFEEALGIEPPPLPDLSGLRKGLLDCFPYDLWEKSKKKK